MPGQTGDPPARAPRGRPRSEQARRAILTAALEIVRDGLAPVDPKPISRKGRRA
jgi:hypothetical protein